MEFWLIWYQDHTPFSLNLGIAKSNPSVTEHISFQYGVIYCTVEKLFHKLFMSLLCPSFDDCEPIMLFVQVPKQYKLHLKPLSYSFTSQSFAHLKTKE